MSRVGEVFLSRMGEVFLYLFEVVTVVLVVSVVVDGLELWRELLYLGGDDVLLLGDLGGSGIEQGGRVHQLALQVACVLGDHMGVEGLVQVAQKAPGYTVGLGIGDIVG